MSFRYYMLDANFYKNSFEDAGIYKNIEEYFVIYNKSLIEESDSNITDFNNIVFTKTLNYLIEKDKVKNIAKTSLENNLDNILDWANDNQDDIIIYIPKNELKEAIDDEEIREIIINEVLGELGKLPECKANEIFKFLEIWYTKDFSKLDCISSVFKEQLESQLTNILPENKIIFDILWEQSASGISDEMSLSSLASQSNTDIKVYRNTMQSLQNLIQWSIVVAPFFGFISIICLLFAVFLSDNNRFSLSAITYLNSSIATLIISQIIRVNAKYIIEFIPLKNIADIISNIGSILKPEMIYADLQLIFETILKNITFNISILSIILIVTFVLLILINSRKK
jgi:hypothetical protein